MIPDRPSKLLAAAKKHVILNARVQSELLDRRKNTSTGAPLTCVMKTN